MKYKKITPYLFIVLILSGCNSLERQNSDVKIVGAMKNVMWEGKLYGNIDLDTISDKQNLYGLGPVEYLAGEITIIDGKAYKSTVVSDSTMKVEETYKMKAPFFGYATISKWTKQQLPDTILSVRQLEQYLDGHARNITNPFMFKLSGTADDARIHIVNLPEGSKVSSPKEAHQGQVNYRLTDEQVDIVGFYSTEHRSVFTHHDTNVHLHLITSDRQKMGHLDDISFRKGTMKLYLPGE